MAFPAIGAELYVQSCRWKRGGCKALGPPQWMESAENVRTPEKPITAADLLAVAIEKLAAGAQNTPVEPLYLKAANYQKK